MFPAWLKAARTLPKGLNRTRFDAAIQNLEHERLSGGLDMRHMSMAPGKCGEMDSFGFVLRRREASNPIQQQRRRVATDCTRKRIAALPGRNDSA
jgi:hypothetical protein